MDPLGVFRIYFDYTLQKWRLWEELDPDHDRLLISGRYEIGNTRFEITDEFSLDDQKILLRQNQQVLKEIQQNFMDLNFGNTNMII